MEDNAESEALSTGDLTYAVPDRGPEIPSFASLRMRVDGKNNRLALIQFDNMRNRLHSRSLLDQNEFAPEVVFTGLAQPKDGLEGKKQITV